LCVWEGGWALCSYTTWVSGSMGALCQFVMGARRAWTLSTPRTRVPKDSAMPLRGWSR
jgi:hypothetical protein